MTPRRLVATALGAAVLAAGALGAAPAAAAPAATAPEKAPVLPARVKDAAGTPVMVKNTRRIVVLNGDVAEVVFALGQGARVVGTDTSATFPPGAAALQRIGYQRTLSAEGILSLAPTLVIGNTTAGPPAVIEQIRAAGVPVLLFPDDDRLTSATTKIRNVARALGVPRRGLNLARRTQQAIDRARARLTRVTTKPRVAFLYVRGSRVQLLGGRGARGDVMVEAAGARDVGSEIGIVGLRPLTAEALVAAAPEVIVVPEAGLASVGGREGLLRLPGVAQTPAGREGRIVAIDDLYLLGLGPRTGSALNELISALHPGLAPA